MPSRGAGAFPAGVGPAGYDPVAALSAKSATTPPQAASFDPQIRDFTSTEGKYDSMHPVDQQVVLALTIRQGSLKSAPQVGNTYHLITRGGGPTLVNDVQNRTRLALKALVGAGKIFIVAIDVDGSIAGQVKVAVSYVNLVTQKRATTSTTAGP